MKLAGTLSGGKMRPVTFDQSPVNATAWAADMPDGHTRLIVINKDSKQKLQLSVPTKHNGRLWRMDAPSLTAAAGVTLAGAEFTPGQPWKPAREEHFESTDNVIHVEVKVASAAVLFFDGVI